jgi:hypothetical protein
MIDPSLISMICQRKRAAAAKAKAQEEEKMTEYSEADLAEKWEFKIIRSSTGAFRRRQTLCEALEQEARAGWELVEKFDDHRVRLRRPQDAGRNDDQLDFDPYRTWIGVSESGLVVRGLAATAACALVVGVVILAVFLVNN